MGVKLNWTGLFLILAVDAIFPIVPQAKIVGAVIFLIGVILMWLDK